jgi:phosphatidylglycerol---prolipoprotein diacylglyceryl transferase
MHPILFSVSIFGKEFIIATYGVIVSLAVVFAFFLTNRLSKYSTLKKDEVFTALIVIAACGIGGAYITGILLSIPDLIKNGFSGYSPVLVSWGGITGGIATALCLWRAWKFSLPDFADLCAPGYLLGIGIGRIGCFFGGCCYGTHTDSWIGVSFSDPITLASYGRQPLVPTQLISAGFLIIAGISFSRVYIRRGFISGNLFGISALCYSVFRFTIEFWRDDPRIFLWKFSDGQLFSICFFITGLIIILRNRYRAVK